MLPIGVVRSFKDSLVLCNFSSPRYRTEASLSRRESQKCSSTMPAVYMPLPAPPLAVKERNTLYHHLRIPHFLLGCMYDWPKFWSAAPRLSVVLPRSATQLPWSCCPTCPTFSSNKFPFRSLSCAEKQPRLLGRYDERMARAVLSYRYFPLPEGFVRLLRLIPTGTRAPLYSAVYSTLLF
jgi:hypothetical protein